MNVNRISFKITTNKFITDSIWSLAGNIVGKGLALVAGIIIARILGKDTFGEYGIIRNTILAIGLFSTFGLGYTSTKYVAEYKESKPEYLLSLIKSTNRITVIFSSVMALVIVIFADYISNVILGAVNLEWPIRILAILIVFNAITTNQIGILSGLGKFKEIAKVNTVVGFITFVSSVLLTYLYDLNGALTALLITQIVNCLLNQNLVKNNLPIGIFSKIDTGLYKSILSFSLPIALQEGIYSSLRWVNNLLLIHFANFGELGLYTAAMQWNAIILFIPGILRNVILSHLSGNLDDKLKHNKIISVTLLINGICTVLPALLIFAFSDMINLMYGKSFQELGNLIGVAVFTTTFMSMSNVYAQAYMSKNMNWEMFLFKLMRELGIIIGFLLFLNFSSFRASEALIYSTLIVSPLFLTLMVLNYRHKSARVALPNH